MYVPSCDVDYAKISSFMCDNDEDLEQYVANCYLNLSIFLLWYEIEVDESMDLPPKIAEKESRDVYAIDVYHVDVPRDQSSLCLHDVLKV